MAAKERPTRASIKVKPLRAFEIEVLIAERILI
jgi:hypothetical protein